MKHLSTLSLVLFLFACFSCQKEEFDSENVREVLVGQWHQASSTFDTLMINSEFTFKPDYTFEKLDKVVDSSGNFLGFRQRAIGIYAVKKDKVTMSYEQFYDYKNIRTGTYYYGNIELKEPAIPVEPSIFKNIIIHINPDKKSLTLQFPPCSYNIHCVADYTQSLFKK